MALEQNEISNKSRLITLLLSFLLVHRFYVGKVVSGFFFFFTAGGLGIWWIIDVIQILSGSFKDQFNKFVFNWEADKKQLGFTIAALVVVMFIGVSSGNKNKKGESTSSSASLTEASKESSAESTAEDKEYKANSFYSYATKIKQSGTTIFVEFAPSLDGTGNTEEKTAGKVNVTFRWSGAGVPSGKSITMSQEVTEDMYSCTMFCKAKLTFDVPKAYLEAAYLDTLIELIPKGKTKGFKTAKQIITF